MPLNRADPGLYLCDGSFRHSPGNPERYRSTACRHPLVRRRLLPRQRPAAGSFRACFTPPFPELKTSDAGKSIPADDAAAGNHQRSVSLNSMRRLRW